MSPSLTYYKVKEKFLQPGTNVDSYQYTCIHLQKRTTFAHSLEPIGREIQHHESCTNVNSYQYVGTHLQKATTFNHSTTPIRRELQPPNLIYQLQWKESSTSSLKDLAFNTSQGHISYVFILDPCFAKFSYLTHYQHLSPKRNIKTEILITITQSSISHPT